MRNVSTRRRQVACVLATLVFALACGSPLMAQTFLRAPAILPQDQDLSRLPDQQIPEVSVDSGEHYVMIENRSDKPMEYQALRTSGNTWTKTYTLPPGMSHKYVFDINKVGSRFSTLGYYGRAGFVVLRFPAGGGWVVQKLVANTPYAYQTDNHGFGYLAEPRNGKLAPKSPTGNLDNQIALLTYNHVFEPTLGETLPPPDQVAAKDDRPPAPPGAQPVPKQPAPRQPQQQQSKPKCTCR